jgi:hypothetical protein
MASAKKVALIKQKNQGTVQINTCVEDPQKSIEELIQKSLEEHKRPTHFERNLNRPKVWSKFFWATTKLFIESDNVYIETKRNVDPYIAFLMHPCVVVWWANQD